MSYLVLARKYRPKTFSELVGQQHVVQALSNALTQQRLHHAYLFTGTRGVGKTTVSRILAKSLNCQGPDGQGGVTATPCGVCQACRDIDSGRFVDYTELDAASNRGVDEIAALLEQAVYKPVQGRFKVFMIDEVHMLSNTAFNAMLKTLEEPPEYLKFVLATTDPQKVPATVLSRCLQFNLRPMAPETVLEHLQQVLQAEAVPADAPGLRLLARAARGSMRDALSLTDQAIAFGSGKIEEDTVRRMLGSVDSSHVFGLIDALARGDGKTVVETSDGLRIQGLSAASTLEEMTLVLQRMAVRQMAAGPGDGGFDDGADHDAAETARLAGLMPPDETQLLYSLCLHGRSELGLAPDEYAALTMVLLRLLAFKPAQRPVAAAEKKTLTPADTALRAAAAPAPRPPALPMPPASIAVLPPAAPKIEQNIPVAGANIAPIATDFVAIQVREQPEPTPRTEQRVAENTAAAAVQPTELGDFWHALVQQLVNAETMVGLVRELALQSQLVLRDTAEWVLRVERASLNQAATRDKLQTALLGQGHAVALVLETGPVTDTPARRNAAAAAELQRRAEETILADPFVQQMLRDYGGKIVPGSIKNL
ncbi:MAG: DNA polymerase III subunit gamma/tau [Pseudomonadota bacterium]